MTARPKDIREDKGAASEHAIQAACVQWFRAARPDLAPRLFAVPNGGARGIVAAARLKAEGVTRGVADLILLKPAGGRSALLVEMKTRRGSLSAHQRAWRDHLTGGGEYAYALCRSLDDFRQAVDQYLRTAAPTADDIQSHKE